MAAQQGRIGISRSGVGLGFVLGIVFTGIRNHDKAMWCYKNCGIPKVSAHTGRLEGPVEMVHKHGAQSEFVCP